MNTIEFIGNAQDWIAAGNAHDPERIMAHDSDDLEWISSIIIKLTGESVGSVRGKTALRDCFA